MFKNCKSQFNVIFLVKVVTNLLKNNYELEDRHPNSMVSNKRLLRKTERIEYRW